MSNSNKNILIILTGSIACYKTCSVISALHQKGYQIKTVLSPSSLQFIGAATIEGLTGIAPVTDMYAKGSIMDHINLNRWADLVLVAPATANYINKIAAGIGDDLLTTLFLSHDFKKPFVIAPAMNTKMYLHPATQESITKLKSYGIEILETASGVLACGEVGYGKLLDPQLIIAEVEKRISQPSGLTKPMTEDKVLSKKVLITSGGTTEPIDDIRSITNTSTGKTAAYLADQLTEAGIQVHFLHAKSSVRPSLAAEMTNFTTYADFNEKLVGLLQRYQFDTVIQLAAVSDYSIARQPGKLSSRPEEIQLSLKKNEKLINRIKALNPRTKLIGFKLTSSATEKVIEEKVKKLFSEANCDYVVQNDWSDIQNNKRMFKFFDPTLKFEEISSVEHLSYKIFKTITETL